MAVEWRREMYELATAAATEYIQSHPDFSLDADQPELVEVQLQGGGTNFVLWGHHREQPVIFKYYHEDWGARRWRNEHACLLHFAATGWVPAIHATVPERLIIMTCLPGRFLNQEVDSGELDDDALAALGHELGRAVGSLVNTPLLQHGDGYVISRDYALMNWKPDLCETVRFYMDLRRRDQTLSAAGADPFYDASLSLVERQIDRISGQRHVIFHEDFHCFVHRGKLQGFFDLEMARLGTELMQLERVFRQCAPDGLHWSYVLSGYGEETGRDLDDDDYVFMLAMALFYYHIRITRWGKPDREADWVARFLPDMKREACKYTSYVNLSDHLPGL